MKLWIARDKHGKVSLFQEKPFLLEKSFFSVSDGLGLEIKQTNNNRTFLKHVVFENSPKQIKIELL